MTVIDTQILIAAEAVLIVALTVGIVACYSAVLALQNDKSDLASRVSNLEKIILDEKF